MLIVKSDHSIIKQAVDRFITKDVYELDHLHLSEAEWELLGEIAVILSVRYYC